MSYEELGKLTGDDLDDYINWIAGVYDNDEGRTASRKFIDDVVGEWTEIKLDILRDYASAYTKIVTSQRTHSGTRKFEQVAYIDAFASSGQHRSRKTQELIKGSPRIALETEPPFSDYYFIDLSEEKVGALERLVNDHTPTGSIAHVFHGDANRVLITDVLPHVRFEQYRRGLGILDPYGMHFGWDVVQEIARTKAIEVFINFPIMDINMNALHHDPTTVRKDQEERMNRFWGDTSWKDVAFSTPSTQLGLFDAPVQRSSKIITNHGFVDAYRTRLKEGAGFKFVPTPVAMKNSLGITVYYLMFASHNTVANGIVEQIFAKHRKRMGG